MQSPRIRAMTFAVVDPVVAAFLRWAERRVGSADGVMVMRVRDQPPYDYTFRTDRSPNRPTWRSTNDARCRRAR